MPTRREHQRPEEFERYAAAMQRANALAGVDPDDQAEIDLANQALKDLGLDGELVRYLDGEAGIGVLRWKLRITTARGSVELELDHASDWKRELDERGFG